MITEHKAITEPVRRLEVFTGAGRRRSWSDEDKARIVAEIANGGGSVSGVARQHGLSPQQLFGWRRQLRASQAGLPEADGPRFVPVVADASPPIAGVSRRRNVQRCAPGAGAGIIEVEIDGVTVRFGPDADVKMVAAVLRALKACA